MKNFFAIFVLLLSAQSVMITAADQQLIKDLIRGEVAARHALEEKSLALLKTIMRLEKLKIQNPELYRALPLSKKSRM